MRDFRLAIRRLRRAPGFTAAAVLALGLGIGTTATVSAVAKGILLRPPPYRDPGRLAFVWHRTPEGGDRRLRVPAPDAAAYGRDAATLAELAFVGRGEDASLTGPGDPARVRVGRVGSNLFQVLGVEAALGRVFAAGEGLLPAEGADEGGEPGGPVAAPADEGGDRGGEPAPAEPNVAVLDHGFWSRRLGRDPDVVGRTLRLNGEPVTVVGVLPAEFELLLPPDAGIRPDADVWTPLRVELGRLRREDRLRDQDTDNTGAVIGRLRPGASVEEAAAELAVLAARRPPGPAGEGAARGTGGTRVSVEPLHAAAVEHARPLLLALLGAVGLLLAIACLNVANLLLVRALDRRREMAVRRALGADTRRLLGPWLAEGAVLAASGCAAGLLLAAWGVGLVRALAPGTLPRVAAIGLDPTVLGIALLAATGAALLFALLCAAGTAGRSGPAALTERSGLPGGGRRWDVRAGLVVAQMALSLTLLVGAGLLLRTVVNLQQVRPGFRTEGVVTFRLARLTDPERYRGPADRARFVRRLEERIGGLPGVVEVGTTGGLPLVGPRWRQPYGPGGAGPDRWDGEAEFRVVTSGYLPAVGTRLLAGRHFTAAEDLHEERRVAIVDERLALHLSPDGTPAGAVGRRLGFPLDGAPVLAEVVGVVENVRHHDLRSLGRESVYVPYRQEASRSVALAVATAREPGDLAAAVRRELRELDPGLPLYDVQGLSAFVAGATAAERLALLLVGAFAAIASFLACVGLYGVVSYAVGRRTREFGLRLALGARERDVMVAVLAGAGRMAAAGIALGLAGAAAGSRVVSGLLYGVRPVDAPTYAALAALLAGLALAGAWIPARRAARADPATALRAE